MSHGLKNGLATFSLPIIRIGSCESAVFIFLVFPRWPFSWAAQGNDLQNAMRSGFWYCFRLFSLPTQVTWSSFLALRCRLNFWRVGRREW